MSGGNKTPRPTQLARELQSVVGLLDRATGLTIESRDGDLEVFVAALLALWNARTLVAGIAVELGAKDGAR